MSRLSFSFPSLKTLKKSKSMELNNTSKKDIEISNIKQIGNYKISHEIGSGAFGKVVLGKHFPTGEKVAIKILDKIILNQTPDDLKLVKQEIEILKIVKHKNIVQLYEILETPRYIFIVMEFCEGGDIMSYILAKGSLSESESLKYFHQLINALYYLHCQNIAHRDIKIDNLLLDSNNDLKLIDFGLSTKYSDDELLNQPCGTIVYAAPEVLDFKDYHGMLADVWSCGIVLYGMLSGFLPFGDSNDQINKKKILEGKIQMPKYFSEGAKNLLRHMLDVNPLTRYTLEDIMEHFWFNSIKFNIIPGIIVGINRIPIDEKILDLCVVYNLDRNKVIKSVINNKFNNESAIYYLLVQKMKKMGQDSVSDLCSKIYINYMLNEGNDILNHTISDKSNTYEINLDKSNNLNIFESKKNRVKIVSDLKRYYNNSNYNRNLNNYFDINLHSVPESDNNNKKFINIENNFKNNIIIFDERKERNETSRNNDNRSNIFDNIFKKKFLENNGENDDDFLKEYLNKNTLETERIITKGKLIKNKKDVFIHKDKEKNKIKIRNNNFPFDKFTKNNYFNTINNNKEIKNNIRKDLLENKNKIKNQINNNIFNKSKNNKNNLVMKSQESKESNPNYDLIFNPNTNILYLPKKKEENKKNMKNRIESQNTAQKQKTEKLQIIQKDNNNFSYLNKSKIIHPAINIPRLNFIKNNKESFKKIVNKEKLDIKYNINFNTKREKNGKVSSKSNETRRIINTQRNENISGKRIIINLYSKNPNTLTLENKLNHTNNSQSKKNVNPTNKKKKFLEFSLNNDKKLNKTSIKSLIDNFSLNNKPPPIMKNNHIINHRLHNKIKNDIYLNEIFAWQPNERNTIGNSTNRLQINKILNLKKNINNTNSNNNQNSVNYNIDNKIKNIHKNKNNYINKILAYKNKSNKVIQTTIKKLNANNNHFKENETGINEIDFLNNKEKCNTSRISVKIRNKKINRNLNRNIFNTKQNNISSNSLFNNITDKKNKAIFIPDKNNNLRNSLQKVNCSNILKSDRDLNIINDKRKINVGASIDTYNKKSLYQMRDLSFSPSKKYLNEKTRKKRIDWKIKKKVIDDKLDSISIFNKLIKKIQLNQNNILYPKQFVKKIDVNNPLIKINKNTLLVKKEKNINSKILKKKELNNISKNYNNSYLYTENPKYNIKKINDLKFSNKKYLLNMSNKIIYSNEGKKINKNIKFKNLNLTKRTNENMHSKYNNNVYLTINNDSSKFNKIIEKYGKRYFEEHGKDSKNNLFINEYNF